MREQNRKNRKKILVSYLILGACLAVIAAVTITLIFTVGKPKKNVIDKPDNSQTGGDNTKPDDTKNPGEVQKPDDENKPVASDNKWGLPLATANVAVATSYEFAYDSTLDRYCVHTGVDFSAKAGDNVCAVLAGQVVEIVKDHVLGENYVKISHANNTTSTYKYISPVENLKVGDSVKKGDVIGKVAAANGMEMKQGEHLHFEMSVNGKTADPNAYLEIIEK